ncbi:MAG: hypothetical protein HYX32_07290 [Actinobacteria bacterium]|nr:hypothetical protein [Actinomycetota bacterium]
MALHEPIRSSIYLKFEELLGTDEAAALMQQFPTYDVSDVVTSEVLDVRLRETEHKSRADIAEVRSEIADVRAEIADVRTEIATLEGRLDARMAAFETKLADLPDIITRQLLFWIFPLFLTSIGLALAVTRLGR